MDGIYHPKEVLISQGIVNREIIHAAWKLEKKAKGGSQISEDFSVKKKWGTVKAMKSMMGAMGASSKKLGVEEVDRETKEKMDDLDKKRSDTENVFFKDKGGLNFVYPYGSTMLYSKAGKLTGARRGAQVVPVLSTGLIAYPLNRPIACVYDGSSVLYKDVRAKEDKENRRGGGSGGTSLVNGGDGL